MNRLTEPVKDTRYTWSVGCSWHGPIEAVGKTEGPISLPCCPHCRSMLMEAPDRESWFEAAQRHEDKGHKNYVAFLNWTAQQKRCWSSLREAGKAFTKETGKPVEW